MIISNKVNERKYSNIKLVLLFLVITSLSFSLFFIGIPQSLGDYIIIVLLVSLFSFVLFYLSGYLHFLLKMFIKINNISGLIVYGIVFLLLIHNIAFLLLSGNFNSKFSLFSGVTIKNYRGNSSIVKIPEKILFYKVTSIGDSAFYNKSISSVIFPDSLKKIGKFAFCGNNIDNISFPDSLEMIEANAFSRNNIEHIFFPDNTRIIGIDAFSDNLISIIKIGDNVLLYNQDSTSTFGSSSIYAPKGSHWTFLRKDGMMQVGEPRGEGEWHFVIINNFEYQYKRNNKKGGNYIIDWVLIPKIPSELPKFPQLPPGYLPPPVDLTE